MKKYIFLVLILPGILTCAQFAKVTKSGEVEAADTSGNVEVISGQPAMSVEKQNLQPVHLSIQQDLGLYLYRNPLTREHIINYFTERTGSKEIASVILRYSDINNLPLSLSFALASVESDFRPHAKNRNASSIDRGLFQLNSRSFPGLTEKDFYNPELNARYGLRYLKTCLEKGGNIIVGLAMYNAGAGKVSRQGTPRMTLDYISKVINVQSEINADIEADMVKTRIVDNTGKRKKTVKYVLDTGKYSK